VNVFSEQHEKKSEGASAAPSDASPKISMAPAKPALGASRRSRDAINRGVELA
jgi:hypothetical protein